MKNSGREFRVEGINKDPGAETSFFMLKIV